MLDYQYALAPVNKSSISYLNSTEAVCSFLPKTNIKVHFVWHSQTDSGELAN